MLRAALLLVAPRALVVVGPRAIKLVVDRSQRPRELGGSLCELVLERVDPLSRFGCPAFGRGDRRLVPALLLEALGLDGRELLREAVALLGRAGRRRRGLGA